MNVWVRDKEMGNVVGKFARPCMYEYREKLVGLCMEKKLSV